MKTLVAFLIAGLALNSPIGAAEPPQAPLVLTVKRQVLDSDRDLRGKQGSVRQQTVTLRVEIANPTAAPVAESELSGNVLVTRTRNQMEKVVKESLGPLKVPAIKPNGKITLDLGSIQLDAIEQKNRNSEETLEEWKVICTLGGAEIGMAVSSGRYEILAKQVAPEKPKKAAAKGPDRKKPRAVAE